MVTLMVMGDMISLVVLLSAEVRTRVLRRCACAQVARGRRRATLTNTF